MKSRYVITVFIIVIGFAVQRLYFNFDAKNTILKSDRYPASTNYTKHTNNKIIKDLDLNYQKYFDEKVSKDSDLNQIKEHVKTIFKNTEESAIIAEYVTSFFMREDTAEFNHYRRNLIADLNNGNQNIYQAILSNEKLIQKDKFIYQMILNLAAQMNFPEAQKARILGGALQIPIQFTGSNISETSTNITNALIHLKNSKISDKLIFNYLKVGMEVNKVNSKSLREFQARANAYFPHMIDQVR